MFERTFGVRVQTAIPQPSSWLIKMVFILVVITDNQVEVKVPVIPVLL